MEFYTVQDLSLHLISSAFQRCRLSNQICRLSIILSCSPSPDHHPFIVISISDTGIGTRLEEYQGIKLKGQVDSASWDGILSIKTTTTCDNEMHHYKLHLKESCSARRIKKLPSNSKNGAKFSGTEVCLSTSVHHDLLLSEMNRYVQKMVILKIPYFTKSLALTKGSVFPFDQNVAVELVAENVDFPGSRYRKVFLENECNQLPLSASNLDRLKAGLEDFVLKHRNGLSEKCNSCSSNWEHHKLGSASVSHCEKQGYSETVIEAVTIISEVPQLGTCVRERSSETQVLYFKEFSPCKISQSSIKALKSIDWRRYGLNLGGVMQTGGSTLLYWENLPPDIEIDIVLHCYHKQTMIPSVSQKPRFLGHLFKKAVKLSLDDLKDKHTGVLLSTHALKISSYAPALGKTIAGLITSSHDVNFQEECFSLLGLQSQEVGTEILENCIKEKITSVIEANDRNPHKAKEVSPFLFEDDRLQEAGIEESFGEGEDDMSLSDLSQ